MPKVLETARCVEDHTCPEQKDEFVPVYNSCSDCEYWGGWKPWDKPNITVPVTQIICNHPSFNEIETTKEES